MLLCCCVGFGQGYCRAAELGLVWVKSRDCKYMAQAMEVRTSLTQIIHLHQHHHHPDDYCSSNGRSRWWCSWCGTVTVVIVDWLG